ncbi:MAG: hypothetical protein JWO38_8271 [Gemmataceae bacterium]|nr:hypothetical protein [Gemmataceae bacterium]
MASGAMLVGLNGAEFDAFVVELDGGLRLRFTVDDWERSGLCRGCRVPVRLPGKRDVWMFVMEEVALPPIVWVVLRQRAQIEVA